MTDIDQQLELNERAWQNAMDSILEVPECETYKYVELCRKLTEQRNRLLKHKRKFNVG